MQRTREWFDARLGRVTASRVADVIARTKTGYSAKRKDYLWDLVVERLTREPTTTFETHQMRWGMDTEPLARAAYEAQTGALVEETGFVLHPAIKDAGASPDGLVGDDGLIEIKCPTTATHLQTISNDGPDERYIPQMMWQMACTQRAWCDFVSFDPRVEEPLSFFSVRVYRNDATVRLMESEVVDFLAAVDDAVRAIRKRIVAHPANLQPDTVQV